MLYKASVACLLIGLVVAGMASGQQSECHLQKTKPELKVHKYVYKDCIVAQFAGYFIDKASNMYLPIENGVVHSRASSCNSNDKLSQIIVINFRCGDMGIYFKRDSLNQIQLNYIPGLLHYNNSNIFYSGSTTVFNTSPGRYYKCDAEQTLTFDTVSLILKNVALEAYRNTSATDFSKVPEECDMDLSRGANLVGVGVAIFLVALVAILLIAYFVRRRS